MSEEIDRGKDDLAMLREELAPYLAGSSLPVGMGFSEAGEPAGDAGQPQEMVRTQVYLTPAQRDFLQNEGKRRGGSMAAALRQIVEERMRPEGTAWMGNPLLDEPAKDPAFVGAGSGNADAEIYGSYEQA
ncbi:MAG: hypothetical protein AB8F34_13655 [Akkermansiaceae bacterium]